MSNILTYENPENTNDFMIVTHQDHRMMIWYTLVALLGGIFIYPLYWGFKKSWEVATTTYYFYPDRVVIEKGLFSKTKNEIQWYRIKSFQTTRSFIEMIFKLGTFDLETSDQFSGAQSLSHLSSYESFYNMINDLTEESKSNNTNKETNHFILK